ncbi:hypothetical protein ACFL3Q_17305 [Planctomycetota bacterium]
MAQKLTYSDSLVCITEDAITFEHYYFPSGKPKVVPLADIERIDVRTPTIWNGKWRIHGTGTFKTWYPQDINRPRRDRIFFAILKNQWVNIGFTVENADRVEAIFRKNNLTKE